MKNRFLFLFLVLLSFTFFACSEKEPLAETTSFSIQKKNKPVPSTSVLDFINTEKPKPTLSKSANHCNDCYRVSPHGSICYDLYQIGNSYYIIYDNGMEGWISSENANGLCVPRPQEFGLLENAPFLESYTVSWDGNLFNKEYYKIYEEKGNYVFKSANEEFTLNQMQLDHFIYEDQNLSYVDDLLENQRNVLGVLCTYTDGMTSGYIRIRWSLGCWRAEVMNYAHEIQSTVTLFGGCGLGVAPLSVASAHCLTNGGFE